MWHTMLCPGRGWREKLHMFVVLFCETPEILERVEQISGLSHVSIATTHWPVFAVAGPLADCAIAVIDRLPSQNARARWDALWHLIPRRALVVVTHPNPANADLIPQARRDAVLWSNEAH